MQQRVLGFGGFFFRARDPGALAAWYEAVLGVTRTPADYGAPCWVQAGGPTVFEPFAADTDHFGNPEKTFMLNFRVADLEAMVAQLQAAGTTVKVNPEVCPNGRFARFSDPEGDPIELWQPDGRAVIPLSSEA